MGDRYVALMGVLQYWGYFLSHPARMGVGTGASCLGQVKGQVRVHCLHEVRPVKMHHLLVCLVRVCCLNEVRPVKTHHLLVCLVRVHCPC